MKETDKKSVLPFSIVYGKEKCNMTNTKNLPEYLKQHGRFCVWKYEADPKRDKPRKMPYNPYTTWQQAKTNDVFTFSDLKTAEAAQKNFDGIGIRIQGNVSGIDIDDCVTDGKLSEMAQDIVNQMDSYTEYSPSGKGIRILFLAHDFSYNTDTYYIKNSNIGLEVYIAGMTDRYLTVTGNTILAKDMEDRADRLQYVLDKYMKRKQTSTGNGTAISVEINLSDSELIKRAKTAKNGTEFALLMAGDWQGRYPSQSEADQAFCNLLAFWTGRDADRMDNIFRASGLYREKWERNGYRMRTINRAISACRDIYIPPTQDKPIDITENIQTVPQEQETEQTTSEASVNGSAEQTAQPSQVALMLQDFQTKKFEPLPTGIKEIDSILSGGFYIQTLVTLGAAPGAGKTMLAQQMFEGVAREGKADIAYINLEMSTQQLIARSLSRMTGYTPLEVMQGYRWTDEQKKKITAVAEEYEQTIGKHFYYLPTEKAYFEDILRKMESVEAKRSDRNLPFICVLDYVQLLQSEKKLDDVETIKASLKAFKDFATAKERKALVFMITAHSRALNESGIVTQGSGRDTSSLEYSADVQLSLNYLVIANGKCKDKKQMIEKVKSHELKKNTWYQFGLVCTKSRFGKSGEHAAMQRDGARSKFIMIKEDTEENEVTTL